MEHKKLKAATMTYSEMSTSFFNSHDKTIIYLKGNKCFPVKTVPPAMKFLGEKLFLSRRLQPRLKILNDRLCI